MLTASSARNLQGIRMYPPTTISDNKEYCTAVWNVVIVLSDKYIKGIKDYLIMQTFGNQEQKYGSR
jgi:hypothetical protein